MSFFVMAFSVSLPGKRNGAKDWNFFMVNAQTKMYSRKWDQWNSLGFWDTKNHPISVRKPDLVQEKWNSHLVDFTIPLGQ